MMSLSETVIMTAANMSPTGVDIILKKLALNDTIYKYLNGLSRKTLDGLDNTATSIRKVLGRDADRELIMAKILDDFERSYNYFSTTGDFKSLFTKWEKNIRYQ